MSEEVDAENDAPGDEGSLVDREQGLRLVADEHQPDTRGEDHDGRADEERPEHPDRMSESLGPLDKTSVG